jgi:hypothetical protein
MGGACGKHEDDEKCIQAFGEKCDEKEKFCDMDVDVSIILQMNLKEICWNDVE